jgi:hypothetical protein
MVMVVGMCDEKRLIKLEEADFERLYTRQSCSPVQGAIKTSRIHESGR